MSDYFTRLQEGSLMTLLTQDYFSALTAVILGFVLIYFAFFNSNRQKNLEKKVDTRSVHKDEKSQSQKKDETVKKERGISQVGNNKKKQELAEKKPNLSEKVDVTQKSLPNTKHEQAKKDNANIKSNDSPIQTASNKEEGSIHASSYSNGSSLCEFQATEALVLLANQKYCQQFKNATVSPGAIRRIIVSETPKKTAATTLANNKPVMRNALPKQDLEIYKNEETKETIKEKKEEKVDTMQFIPDKEVEKDTLTTGDGVMEGQKEVSNKDEQKVKTEKQRDIKKESSIPLVNEISEPVPDLEAVTPSPVVNAVLPEKEEESKQREVTTVNKDEGTTTAEAVNENKTVDPIFAVGAIATGAGILEASREICATTAEEEKSDLISESKPAESISVTSDADSEEIKTNGDITTTTAAVEEKKEDEAKLVQEVPAATSSTDSDYTEENETTAVGAAAVILPVEQNKENTVESLPVDSDVLKVSSDREIADEKTDVADANTSTPAANVVVSEVEKSVEPVSVPEKTEEPELPVENKDTSTVSAESDIDGTIKPVTLASTPLSELPIEDTTIAAADNKEVAVEPIVLADTPASEEPKDCEVNEVQNTTAPVVEEDKSVKSELIGEPVITEESDDRELFEIQDIPAKPVESKLAEEPVVAEESKDREVTETQDIPAPVVNDTKPIEPASVEEAATASAETKVQKEEPSKDDLVTAALATDEKPTEPVSVTESISDNAQVLETSKEKESKVASGEEAADVTTKDDAFTEETTETKVTEKENENKETINTESIDVAQKQETTTDESSSEPLSCEEKESEKSKDSIKEKENASAAVEQVKSIETPELISTSVVDEVLEDSNKAKESDDQLVPVVLNDEKPVESTAIVAENSVLVDDSVNREVNTSDKTEAVQTKDEQIITPETNTTPEKSTHVASVESTDNQPSVDTVKESEKLEAVTNDEKENKVKSDESIHNETVSREMDNKGESSPVALEPNPTTSTASTVDSLESNVNTSSQPNDNFEAINGYMGSPFSQNNFHQMYDYPKMSDPTTFAAVPSAVTPSSQPREKRFLTRLEKIDRQMQSYAPRMKARCTFWPNCTNKNCKYWHPIKECRMGQNCTFRNKCMFLHPNDMVDEQPRKRKVKPVHNK